MAQGSTIEWTETTWNPVVGCRRVSEGCRHCYAERMALRLAAMSKAARASGQNPGRKAAYAAVTVPGRGWNGEVVVDEAMLDVPRRWRSPQLVFVNSMSDLFHEDVPVAFIQKVFGVMEEHPQHTFQVLTKRPERAAEIAADLKWSQNIWLGVSVEDSRVQGRIESLRQVPAAVRFLSLEPLLGPLLNLDLDGIGWVIVGGESGPGARPMDAAWVREIQRTCHDFGAAFFFKQWGGVNKKKSGRILDGRTWDEMPATGMA